MHFLIVCHSEKIREPAAHSSRFCCRSSSIHQYMSLFMRIFALLSYFFFGRLLVASVEHDHCSLLLRCLHGRQKTKCPMKHKCAVLVPRWLLLFVSRPLLFSALARTNQPGNSPTETKREISLGSVAVMTKIGPGHVGRHGMCNRQQTRERGPLSALFVSRPQAMHASSCLELHASVCRCRPAFNLLQWPRCAK